MVDIKSITISFLVCLLIQGYDNEMAHLELFLIQLRYENEQFCRSLCKCGTLFIYPNTH